MTINVDEIRWATDDENDPNTGAPNKLEPTEQLKDSGLKFEENFGRQWQNFLASKYYEFIKDLDERVTNLENS